jgi:hypothetical protein
VKHMRFLGFVMWFGGMAGLVVSSVMNFNGDVYLAAIGCGMTGGAIIALTEKGKP